MGYGLPAAVAAKLLHPERTVMLRRRRLLPDDRAGFATAVQYAAGDCDRLNNGMYGTIRMHQERTYPGRVSGTDLTNPDFAALARAFGGFGARSTAPRFCEGLR